MSDLIKCEYCHEDGDGYVCALDKNGHAFISFKNIHKPTLVLLFGKERRETEIDYCPMCGRGLRH